MPALLAMDVGTTNWKAALFAHDGSIIGAAGVPAQTLSDAHGQYYDAEQMWVCLARLVRRLITESAISSIDAISVASMGETVIPVGVDGTAVYQAITWFDPRSSKQADAMRRMFGTDRLFEITGLDSNPMFSLPKIAWIRDNDPAAFARADHWLSIADYVVYRLSGEMATDYSLASRTLAFDLATGRWSAEILDAMELSATMFPPVVRAGTRIGTVTHSASRQTGIAEGTPVVVGGHDHHCAFLAAGALIDDVVLDSSGTSESIMTLLPNDRPRPKIFRGMRLGFFIDPRWFCTMGGVSASGASVEWAIRNIWAADNGSPRYDEVMEAVETVAIGCDGLCFLPHLRGAGAPVWDVRSRGAFVGLRAEHSRAHLMRAVFEGLCLELRVLLTAIEKEFDRRITTLNSVGGGTRNSVWQQIKADVTGVTVRIPDVREAAAQGAALLAGLGIGVYPDLVEASRSTFNLVRVFEPCPEYGVAYTELYSVYKDLYGQLREINAALSSLRGHDSVSASAAKKTFTNQYDR